MTHRQADLLYRALGVLTDEPDQAERDAEQAARLRNTAEQRRIIAIGRATNGSGFLVTAPKQPNVFALIDEDDFTRYMEFDAGYTAYNNLRGPGVGRNRAMGWLEAHRESAAYIEERAEERREQQ